MFPRCEDHAAERHHVFLPYSLTDHDEGLPADLAIGGDVVRKVPVEFIDLASGYELPDFDRVRASDRNGLQLIVM
jgi:hypothetical protein